MHRPKGLPRGVAPPVPLPPARSESVPREKTPTPENVGPTSQIKEVQEEPELEPAAEVGLVHPYVNVPEAQVMPPAHMEQPSGVHIY